MDVVYTLAFRCFFEENPREGMSSNKTGGSFLDLSEAALRAAVDIERECFLERTVLGA